MMELPITSLTAAALALLMVVLAIDTIRSRIRSQTALGPGDDPRLLATSRAHGNLTENAPIALILIALLEAGGAERSVLAVVAALFVAGRVLHAIGLYMRSSGPPAWPRSAGVVVTLLTLIGLSGWLVVRVLV